MRHIVSFSGGKDSTAMLLMMIEKGMQIDEIRAFDTGWEFPQMYEHWAKVEDYIGRKINVIHPKKSFRFWMFEHGVIARGGPLKGQVHRIGYGWPSHGRWWCTREKQGALNRASRGTVMYVGIAADEEHRIKKGKIYPLIEWGITEAAALKYCMDRGFDWGGLYSHFDRVSCFCCPLQPLDDLRTLRRHFPELWHQMLDWEKDIPYYPNSRGFRDKSVAELDARFAKEEAEGVSL